MSHIMIVDDEPSICWALEQALSSDGHDVVTTASAENALKMFGRDQPDVVVLDIRLPGLDGLAALEKLRDQSAETPVVMMTAFGSLDSAVKAVNRGAFEYLTKPFDLEEAVGVIQRALDSRQISASGAETEPAEISTKPPLLGTSPFMQEVFRKIAYVSQHDVSVLITGEAGTGKELVAAAIHHHSRRSEGSFVPISLPATNDFLVESELFGRLQETGGGLVSEQAGMLQAADQGTAYFAEISDVSAAIQVKLLRALETGQIMSVGANRGSKTDFRLIAATNCDLENLVAVGQFREDLFYRLNVYRIEIPPLRERLEDIPQLANHFIQRLDPQGNVKLSADAIAELQQRTWKGNVRELQNVIEHAVIATRIGEIHPPAFPPPAETVFAKSNDRADLKAAIAQWWEEQISRRGNVSTAGNLYEQFLDLMEPELLAEALRWSEGNRQQASHVLGIHRQTLREKLKKYGLNEDL